MKLFNAVESAELKPQLSMSDENDERLIIIKCHDEKIVILYKKKNFTFQTILTSLLQKNG